MMGKVSECMVVKECVATTQMWVKVSTQKTKWKCMRMRVCVTKMGYIFHPPRFSSAPLLYCCSFHGCLEHNYWQSLISVQEDAMDILRMQFGLHTLWLACVYVQCTPILLQLLGFPNVERCSYECMHTGDTEYKKKVTRSQHSLPYRTSYYVKI